MPSGDRDDSLLRDIVLGMQETGVAASADAKVALSRLDGHEERCTERYGALNNKVNWLLTGLVTVLLMMVLEFLRGRNFFS